MKAETAPHQAVLGFGNKRIQETLSLLGLNAGDSALAERLRIDVIAGKADELVNSCFEVFARSRGFSSIEKHIGVESFKQVWVRRLQCFGENFDTAEYFEERLRTASAFARVEVPLSTLQLSCYLTQQVLAQCLSDRFQGDCQAAWPLLDIVFKLTFLDLYLAAEGYHLPQIDELHEDLDKLREETVRLEERTSIDALTGVMNYGKLMESLDHQINQARRQGQGENPLCLIMADLDFFKKINDTYGHVVGDLVLQHVTRRIEGGVRDTDLVGRFGGEEFVVIMAKANLDLAKSVAERIREGVMSTPLHVKGFNIPITISLGAAMLRQGERKESLLERADAAMYEAKRSGRNRVVLAD